MEFLTHSKVVFVFFFIAKVGLCEALRRRRRRKRRRRKRKKGS